MHGAHSNCTTPYENLLIFFFIANNFCLSSVTLRLVFRQVGFLWICPLQSTVSSLLAVIVFVQHILLINSGKDPVTLPMDLHHPMWHYCHQDDLDVDIKCDRTKHILNNIFYVFYQIYVYFTLLFLLCMCLHMFSVSKMHVSLHEVQDWQTLECLWNAFSLWDGMYFHSCFMCANKPKNLVKELNIIVFLCIPWSPVRDFKAVIYYNFNKPFLYRWFRIRENRMHLTPSVGPLNVIYV